MVGLFVVGELCIFEKKYKMKQTKTPVNPIEFVSILNLMSGKGTYVWSEDSKTRNKPYTPDLKEKPRE